MATVYLGLGANLGDRLHNLKQALELLSEKTNIVCVSPVYETEPVGYTSQPMFLNAVCEATTGLEPEHLLEYVKSIEKKLGRVPGFRNAPRPVDIDILFYDNRIIQSDELIVPHPRIKERAFVLVPLADVAPDLIHPVLDRPVRELLARVKTEGVERFQ